MKDDAGDATGRNASSPQRAGAASARQAAENSVIWTLWLTYGAFYFCRTNISAAVAAVPGMKTAVAEGGLALSGEQIGWILASLKIAYGLGQLVNGQLAERISPRVMLAIGMFGSAALNAAFGFGTGFYFLLFVWAMNGFCQSLGWTPTVRVVANWIPVARRGQAIGVIGTGYQITFGLTYLIAGQSTKYLGWRGAFYVPAALLALAGIAMLVLLRESPTGTEGSVASRSANEAKLAAKRSIAETLYWTLYNPALWLLGGTLLLVNACRYGYIDWGLAHLVETRGTSVDKAVLQYFVIAIGATAGSYVSGWATDRFFGSRRAPVVFILLVLLGLLSLVYEPAVRRGALETMLLLVAIGFCIIGPQVLLVGTAPADLAHRGTSAAAAGFVNFMGYVGAAMGDVVTGYFSAPEHGGWRVVIFIWAGWAFAGAAIMTILWNTTSANVGLLPSRMPKLGAIAALAGAAAATAYGGQPVIMPAATAVAAVCAVGAWRSAWAIVPGILAALGGVSFVFISYVQSGDRITWSQGAAILAYGLAMIAALMILVDREWRACESS